MAEWRRILTFPTAIQRAPVPRASLGHLQFTYPVPELYSSGFLMVLSNLVAFVFVVVRTHASTPGRCPHRGRAGCHPWLAHAISLAAPLAPRTGTPRDRGLQAMSLLLAPTPANALWFCFGAFCVAAVAALFVGNDFRRNKTAPITVGPSTTTLFTDT